MTTRASATQDPSQHSPSQSSPAEELTEADQNGNRYWAALLHADAAEDWSRISGIVLQHFHRLPGQAHPALLDVLDRIPGHVLPRYPHLGYYRVLLLSRTPGVARLVFLAAAEEVLTTLDPEPEGYLELVNDAVRFATYGLTGEYERADSIIGHLLPRVEALGAMSEAAVAAVDGEQGDLLRGLRSWVAKGLRQYGAAVKMLLGDYPQALAMLQPVVMPLADRSGELKMSNLYAVGVKALILAIRGRVHEARKVLNWAASFDHPPLTGDEFYEVPAILASTYLDIADRQLEAARAELNKVWELRDASAFWPLMLDLQARIALNEPGHRGLSEFETELEAIDQRPLTSTYLQVQLYARAAELAVGSGTISRAERYLDKARQIAVSEAQSVCESQTQALLDLLSGHHNAVRDRMLKLLDLDTLTTREEVGIRLMRATAEHALARRDATTRRSRAVAEKETKTALLLADDAGITSDIICLPPEYLAELIEAYAPHRKDVLAALAGRLGSQEGNPFYQLQDVDLTEGEYRVLKELAHTDSRTELARRLYLSVNTVKTHLRRLYRKLSATSRDEALERAYALNLLERP